MIFVVFFFKKKKNSRARIPYLSALVKCGPCMRQGRGVLMEEERRKIGGAEHFGCDITFLLRSCNLSIIEDLVEIRQGANREGGNTEIIIYVEGLLHRSRLR